MIEADRQPLGRAKMIRNCVKTLKLTTFRTLAIADMQRRNFVTLTSDGCCNTAIHSTAGQNDGFGFNILIHFCFLYGRSRA
jgi:hypothetical protein